MATSSSAALDPSAAFDSAAQPTPGAKTFWHGNFSSPGVWLVAVCCIVCLACVPFTYYVFDVKHCWLTWSEATHGTTPWLPYRLTPDCNYPSFMLYVFTVIEKIRLATHTSPLGKLVLVLLKLPSILAMIGGIALCYYGLRARLGDRYARVAAVAYALCVTLWFNAAVWGQFDALLCLGMIGAVIALVNDRPGWCGAALALALTVKLQAIIIFPALLVYWLARFGWRAVAAAAGAGIVVWSLVSAPFFLGGGGHGLMQSYVGAVGFYQLLDVYAWNGWWLVLHIGGHVLHLKHADVDTTKVLNLITFKQIGILTYLGYMVYLLVGLWRRPTRYNGVLACAMLAFAFFMLPTEIHERYIIPAVALAALLVPAVGVSRTHSAFALFVALNILSIVEELQYCHFNPNPVTMHITHLQHIFDYKIPIGFPGTLIYIGLFIWASVMYWREVYLSPPDAPDFYALRDSADTKPAPA